MAERLVNRLQTTRLVGKMMEAYWEEVRQAPQQGRLLAWTVGPIPFEILRVMDIAFEHMETHGAFLANRLKDADGKKGSYVLKEMGHALGYVPDMCSYSRYVLGLAERIVKGETSDLRPDLIIPKPDLVVGINSCLTMGCAAETIGRFFNVPRFTLDVPLRYTDEDTPGAIAFSKQQIEEFIAFLENVTGRRFDYDKLVEMMVRVKEQATLRMECIEMQKNIPAPMTFFDLLISLGPAHVLRGLPESLEYYKTLKAEVGDKVAKGLGSIPDERHRLFWDNLAIWHKVGSLSEKLAALGAVMIVGSYTHLSFWRRPWRIVPEKPLDSLAEEHATGRMPRSPVAKTNDIIKLCEDYHIDGLVMHSSRTCRPEDIGQNDVIDEVSRRIGVPGIQIESDPTDPDYHSEAQVDTRLQAFAETLEARKKYGH